jgi:hypothetical protein
LKVLEAVLPALSLAEHKTDVVPKGKVEPEDGEQETVGLAGFVSVAVAEKLTFAPVELDASAVILDGKLRVGGVLSTIIASDKVKVFEPPEQSSFW